VVLTPAFSIDFIVGARGGYFVWKPYFQEMEGSGVENVDDGTGALYGPALSIIFNDDFTFSSTALFGVQSTYWIDDDISKAWGPDTIQSTGTFFGETNRVDLDSALSYRISHNIKVFFGYKYQYTETELKGTFLADDIDELYVIDVLVKCPSHGPALGVGYSQAMGTNFFVSTNFSGLFMFSKYNYAKDSGKIYNVNGAEINQSSSYDEGGTIFDMKNIGLNVEPTIGMNIGGIVSTLGLRFQWMATKFDDPPIWAPNNWMNDFLYGVFVGALYQF